MPVHTYASGTVREDYGELRRLGSYHYRRVVADCERMRHRGIQDVTVEPSCDLVPASEYVCAIAQCGRAFNRGRPFETVELEPSYDLTHIRAVREVDGDLQLPVALGMMEHHIDGARYSESVAFAFCGPVGGD